MKHFIPQIAPRLVPQDEEESGVCVVDGGIQAPLQSDSINTCEVILSMKIVLRGIQSNPVNDGLEKQSGSTKSLARLKLSALGPMLSQPAFWHTGLQ